GGGPVDPFPTDRVGGGCAARPGGRETTEGVEQLRGVPAPGQGAIAAGHDRPPRARGSPTPSGRQAATNPVSWASSRRSSRNRPAASFSRRTEWSSTFQFEGTVTAATAA